jgi:hypothetical protein
MEIDKQLGKKDSMHPYVRRFALRQECSSRDHQENAHRRRMRIINHSSRDSGRHVQRCVKTGKTDTAQLYTRLTDV